MATNTIKTAREKYLKIKRALKGPGTDIKSDESWVLPALNFRLQAKYGAPTDVGTGDRTSYEKTKKSAPGAKKK